MKNQPDWWDPYSCQPYKMRDEDKPRTGFDNILEYSKVAASNLVGLPLIAARYLMLRPKPSTLSADEFVGLSVMPDKQYESAIVEMVEELGVKQLLLRIPSWDVAAIEDYVAFMALFPKHEFVVNILQSRESVANIDEWRSQLKTIVEACYSTTKTFWIGNAINRTKWGCAHTGDYFALQAAAESLRGDYQGLKLLGSSIIDFEPLLSWRTLWNLHNYQLDANACLMYVNRRHSPYGTQYGIFDLQNKLRLSKAMTLLSNRCSDELWVTETNWPLLNTKPYTPNSGNPTRTVDEKTQAEYLRLYYQIAYQTGWVEKVYWWQLINPGYGLVDHREGSLRKMPSYFAMKDIIAGDLKERPLPSQG